MTYQHRIEMLEQDRCAKGSEQNRVNEERKKMEKEFLEKLRVHKQENDREIQILKDKHLDELKMK